MPIKEYIYNERYSFKLFLARILGALRFPERQDLYSKAYPSPNY